MPGRVDDRYLRSSETIANVGDQVRRGERSCVDVVESCLARIEELEPLVRAWVIVDRAGARDQARRLDAELAAGNWRGPLHGIPIGIKDLVDVAGFVTAAGSPLLADNVAARDATVVARLRQAGAVILGKTVTTQFASFDPPATRNPWNFERTPGGSSSGSAAAVACGMCLGTIGSQTGGSITRPASYCGVAGCKPTYGLVSADGVMPLAPSMDHPGPIARTVADVAILLDAIADPTQAPKELVVGRASRLPASSLVDNDRLEACPTARVEAKGGPPRLGLLRGLFWDQAEEVTRRMLDDVTAGFRRAGAEVTEVALPSSFTDVLRSHRVIMAVEAAVTHHDLFARHADSFLPKIRGLVEEGLAAAATDYARARQHQQSLSLEILSCFDGGDALLTPATIGPAPDTSTTGDPTMNSPWSFTGLPTVSFPVFGRSAPDAPGLALQLVGQPHAERALLCCAQWCKRTTDE
jgi:aspartyl-tRNA(Asn)/glutamyl-tRNA(Gln) amidotransferase subunit A